MDTIGMDAYGFVAGAALNVLTQQDGMLTVVRSVLGVLSGPRWSGKRRWKGPLAYIYSSRDNPDYRAANGRAQA